MRRCAVGILMALILPLTACTVVEGDYGYDDYPRYGDYPRHGGYYPPPRHGHWRWDDDLRVYVSTGYPRTYYHDHTYYRWNDNHWSSGRQFNGPWRVIEHRHVPPRLGQRYHSQPRYDNRHYDNRRHDYRGDGQWERRDQGRYYGPGTPQREWRNPSEGEQRLRAWQQEQERERDWRRQRELQQQQRQWQQQRLDVRQERQWPQQRIETRPQRQWQSQRPERQQEHQWQQRPQRQWQQREPHRQQQVGEQRHERRMASPSSSSPDDAGGQRMGPARQRDGGRQWQERGESRGER
ncbi:hypothetical protein [Pseudomonas sp. AN-1]|uniref:hypothetical protein n=1 Tax=Pseudomonas sp. AN-1 TaxID=3096605 RepID=UPI002A698BFA|nr:hypothetical protein [Pseudomonas sp. AN-1]WPP47426.1 hypothetical protein SK095_08660 [Pseudomonas sp. AN-1]